MCLVVGAVLQGDLTQVDGEAFRSETTFNGPAVFNDAVSGSACETVADTLVLTCSEQ